MVCVDGTTDEALAWTMDNLYRPEQDHLILVLVVDDYPVTEASIGFSSAAVVLNQYSDVETKAEQATLLNIKHYERFIKRKQRALLGIQKLPPNTENANKGNGTVTSQEDQSESSNRLERLSSAANTKVTILKEYGNPKDTLTRVAVEEKADLLVVGFRASASLKYAIVGSTSQHLVTHLKIPVIVIPLTQAEA